MGEVFAGRYELIDPIGEGGMGTVWRVWDRRERRVVAAKVLRQSDAVSLLRFVREQAVRVQHPHVLTPLGWAGEDDRVLFTMPVVDGGSVATLVGDHGPLPPLLVAELLRQLLDAVAAVHDARILHRDIKPANVLLRATGTGRPHAWLTDFGIALDLDGPRFTQTGEWTGTPGYVAPEVTRGAEPAPTSDLYAVGQVAVAMLTGARPTSPPVRPDDVPDALWSLVTDLTAFDAADRPPDATAPRARLEGSGLTWHDGALGDVEVLRQVEPPADGRPQLTAGDPGPQRQPHPHAAGGRKTPVSSADETPLDAEPHAPRADRSPPPRSVPAGPPTAHGRAVAALAVALAVLGGLVLWSPWSGADEAPTAPPATTTTARASSPSNTPLVTGNSTSLPTAPTSTRTGTHDTGSTAAHTASPGSGPSPGSVQVGTVVSRVGQPCEFSDVGLAETTTGGEDVICSRRSDGSYHWDPAP